MLKFCKPTMAALLLLTTASLCAEPLWTVESLSEKVGLPSHCGTQKPYSAMSVINNLTDLYKNNIYKGDELDMFNQQVAHYICFGKFKKNTNEFIPDTADNLVSGTRATTPQVKDIFNLFLWGAMRYDPVSSMYSLAGHMKFNFNDNKDAKIKGHLKGAYTLSSMASSIISSYQQDEEINYTLLKECTNPPYDLMFKNFCEAHGIDPFDLGKKVYDQFNSQSTTANQTTPAPQTVEDDIPSMQSPGELTKEEKKQNFLAVFGQEGVTIQNRSLLNDPNHIEGAFSVLGMTPPAITEATLNNLRDDIKFKLRLFKKAPLSEQPTGLDQANDFLRDYLNIRERQLIGAKKQKNEQKIDIFLRSLGNLDENAVIEKRLLSDQENLEGALCLLDIDPEKKYYEKGLWSEVKRQKEVMETSSIYDKKHIMKAFNFLEIYLDNQFQEAFQKIQSADLNTIEGKNTCFEKLNTIERLNGNFSSVFSKFSKKHLARLFFVALDYLEDNQIKFDASDFYLKGDIRMADWGNFAANIVSNIVNEARYTETVQTQRLSGAIFFVSNYLVRLQVLKTESQKVLVADVQNHDLEDLLTRDALQKREKYKKLYDTYIDNLVVVQKDFEEKKKTLRVVAQEAS